ncbi:hypothetical protein PMZ80_009548 [Knufia obscura]|uniref:Uncharacterized protein n=1 Tax=Knufia obscura TaxID=1635080 RepID=A0ABR0RCY1_9EURO|nr:hypothetical protein PMZ80_009548 [Knufia obscura]
MAGRRMSNTYMGGGDSYRPGYESRRASSPRRPSPVRRTSPPPQLRADDRGEAIPTGPKRAGPNLPSRSVSHVGSFQYYPPRMQTDGATRSANTTPTESPRSPTRTNNGDNATRSLDPRREKMMSRPADGMNENAVTANGIVKPNITAAGQPSKVGQVETLETSEQPSKVDLGSNVVNQWLRENIKRAVLEDRLDRTNEEIEQAIQEEKWGHDHWPGSKHVADQTNSARNKLESKVSKLSARMQESFTREKTIVESMTDQQRGFLSGVMSDTVPMSSAQSTEIVRKVEKLERQLQAQDLEIQRLQDLNRASDAKQEISILRQKINIHQERLDACEQKAKGQGQQIDHNNKSIQSQKTALSMLDQRFDQRSTACEQKINDQGQKIDEHGQNLQAHKDSFNVQKQLISDLDLKVTAIQNARGDTVDALPELRAKVKSHDFEFARLSSLFVSQKDHKELSSTVDGLKTSQSKFEAEVATAKSNLDAMSVANTKTTNKLDRLEASTAGMKDDLLQTIRLSAQSHSQGIPKEPTSSSTPDLSALEAKVDKLFNFEGHYEKFYKDTESSLRDTDTRLKHTESSLKNIKDLTDTLDSTLQRLQNQHTTFDAKQTEAKRFAETSLGGMRQTIASLRDQVHAQRTANPVNPKDLPVKVTSKLSNIEKQYNEFVKTAEATIKQNLAITKQEIDVMKPLVSRNDNSIKALDTRFNAISTGPLYRSIVNALIPVGPLCDQVKNDHAQLSKQVLDIQTRNVQLQNDVNEIKLESSRQVSTVDPALQTEFATLKERHDKLTEDRQGILSSSVAEDLKSLAAKFDDLQSKVNSAPAAPDNAAATDPFSSTVQEVQDQLAGLRSRFDTDTTTRNQLVEAIDRVVAIVENHGEEANKQAEKLTKCVHRMDLSDKAVAALRLEIKDVKLKTGQIPGLQSGLSRLQNQVEAFDSSKIPTPPDLPQVAKVENDVQELQRSINDLRRQLPPNSDVVTPDSKAIQQQLEDCLKALLYRQDSFIKISRLASTVNDTFVKKQLEDVVQVRNTWFRGGKDPVTKTTSRYALVQLQTSDPSPAITKVNAGQKWRGRDPLAEEANSQTIANVLLNKPEIDRRPSLTPGASLYSPSIPETASVVAGTDNYEDTITVDDSARQTSIQATPSVPPNSQSYLKEWLPNPPVAKGTPVPRSRTNTPAGNATPSTRGVKRSAEELGRSNSASRPVPKRGRHNS